ncbi:ski oncolocus tag [Echinococcus multilocularis]|uniref:Ski oncolocus tag n=1 Tax=Echinococcus multilocularis TaxID=6211 RepID=A0A068Y7P8_ECHMU|nr:ski oncolocus tag [Echinococcus multilocularis]
MTQAASFSDKTNPMNPLIPRNLCRQMDGVTNGAPLPNPLTAVSFLPESVRLPAEIEASYLNLLAMNSHILSPFARQLLLGNQNLSNLNTKRPLVPPPPPQTITNFPSQASSSMIPSSTSVSSSCSSFSLPRPHEIEETGELVYSIVEGEKVMGFNVWGEVRLCLPHLLRFVLNDVDIDEIGQAISKLRIVCTKCSPCQLAMLHGCNALPSEVTSCGLIRKSDAERMLKFLRSSRRRPTLADACPNIDTANGRAFISEQTDSGKSTEERDETLGSFIDVRHDCFGTQRGRVYPHLYNSVTSPCIVCRTCNKLFSPQDFVGHTHSVNESDSCCHWGFDSTNWRSYLQLDIDSVGRQKKVKRESSESGEEENPDVRTYRALRDFKVKFLKPLHLPNEITKIVPGLKGHKTDAKRQQPLQASLNEAQPLDCSTNKPPSTPSSSTAPDVLRPAPEDQQQAPDDTRLEIRLRPNLKIRRLWAPHQGRLRIPNPPKLISDCPRGPKPRNLSSGPPVLLDPSCIVTKDSAQLYGRDFIPNVCLKPVTTPASTGSGGQSQLHLSRSLPSVPSNEDIVASAAEKRLSEADLFPDLRTPGGHRSRPILRGLGIPLSADFILFQHSNQGLNSIDSSPARARHPSSAHDAAVLALSNPLDLHKRCATEEVLRCPSVDSAPAPPFHGQLSRTTSDPEINISAVRSGVKRGHTGSWSLTPASSGISPSRRKRLLETTGTSREDQVHAIKSVENRRPTTTEESSFHHLQHQSQNWFSNDALSSQTTPEMLINLATDANPRIPNIIAHWTSTLERINQFCNSIVPTDESAKCRFDIERQKLMVDLNILREKNLLDLSMVLKDNKRLWKLLTDVLLLTGASPSLTPNTLAPPCGVIPGVADVDQITRLINLLQGFKPKVTVSENFRQSASMAVTEYQLNERNRQFWPPSNIGYRSATPEMLPTTSPSVRTSSLATAANGAESPPLSSGDFLLPSKRQRLFRHSYSASSNLNT